MAYQAIPYLTHFVELTGWCRTVSSSAALVALTDGPWRLRSGTLHTAVDNGTHDADRDAGEPTRRRLLSVPDMTR